MSPYTSYKKEPVFPFLAAFFISFPHLFSLRLIIRKKKKAMCEKKRGGGCSGHTHRGIQGGKREHITIGREK